MKAALQLLLITMLGFTSYGQKLGVKSTINFEVDNFKVNTVEGSFSDITGSVSFDPAKLEEARFDVKIAINSINTGNDTRDRDLQEEEYFNSVKYPQATFVSTSVERVGDKFWVKGNLTIKGISKPVNIPFTLSYLRGGYLLSGPLTLDRYDFKVGSSSSISIGREVSLQVNCYLVN
jgi:polyisoprenoid-binding protein YceI